MIVLRKVLLFVCMLFELQMQAQPIENISLKNGDLLFQNLDCGDLCDAIEAVTEGFDGKDFSHIGLVYIRHDTAYVIEAIGKNVHLTPLPLFMSRTENKVYIGRAKSGYVFTEKAMLFALKKIGTAYDDEFLYDNGKYYCSELIYDAFMYANNGTPFFELEPMTFRMPGTKDFFPAWVKYYNELGKEIPEAHPGINPGGISRSGKIVILNK